MEEHHIKLKDNFYALLPQKEQNKVLQEISFKIKNIFIDQIREVYLINSRIRDKENYLPMEDIISAVQVKFTQNSDSFVIYIDTESLQYQDSEGNPIFKASNYRHGDITKPITDFEDHWYTPIEHMQEMDWVISTTIEKATRYIEQNYIQTIKKHGRIIR